MCDYGMAKLDGRTHCNSDVIVPDEDRVCAKTGRRHESTMAGGTVTAWLGDYLQLRCTECGLVGQCFE